MFQIKQFKQFVAHKAIVQIEDNKEMELLDSARVKQFAQKVYNGVDFQADLLRGNLARDSFVKSVCSAIKADFVERFPEKVFTFPRNCHFWRSVRAVLQNRTGVQPIRLSSRDKPRAAKARGQKRQLVDSSSSEEEGASGSGEKGNSPPSAQEERSPGAQSQSPTPLPKGRRGQGASGCGGQVESPPPAPGESSPGTRSNALLLQRIAALELEVQQERAANAVLEAKVLKYEDLFRVVRKPTRNTSGSAETFTPALQAIALEAMAGGTFAKHVRNVLDALARIMDLCPDPDTHRVPTERWFAMLRSKQDLLLKQQRDEFLSPGNGPFMPAFDATRLGQHSTLALGEYLFFSLTLSCRSVDISTLTPPPQICLYLGPSPSVLDNSSLNSYNFLASLQIIFNLENCQLRFLDNLLSIIYYLFSEVES